MPPWFANPMSRPGRLRKWPSPAATAPETITAATLTSQAVQLHSIPLHVTPRTSLPSCENRPTMRALALAVIVGLALMALYVRGRPSSVVDTSAALTFVTTANQLGVVGYRDPVGADLPRRPVRRLQRGPLRARGAGGRGTSRHAAAVGRPGTVADVAGRSPRACRGHGVGDALVGLRCAGRHARTTVGDHCGIHSGLGCGATLERPPSARRQRRRRMAGGDCRGHGRSATLAHRHRTARAPSTCPTGDAPIVAGLDARARSPASSGVERPRPHRGAVRSRAPGAGAGRGGDRPHRVLAGRRPRLLRRRPNDAGFVDLWQLDRASRRASRLTGFSRDTYAPSVARDGTVMFQGADLSHPRRRAVAGRPDAPADHVPVRDAVVASDAAADLAHLRHVAPRHRRCEVSRHRAGDRRRRRRAERFRATSRSQVIADSDSEDQAMTWSPNGKWIAFHTHREMSDDVWLRPADGEQPDKRITFLGRGAEVGWPRWSPDGRTVLLDGAARATARRCSTRSASNQDTGEVTSPTRGRSPSTASTGEMRHAEWLPAAAHRRRGREGRSRAVTRSSRCRSPVARATVVHRFATEHDFSGPRRVARRAIRGVRGAGAGWLLPDLRQDDRRATQPVQLTTDRSHKTQPALSPDGARVAFTVWSYEAAFWSFNRRR